MNKAPKAKYGLSFFFLLLTMLSFAQTNQPPAPDDDFNVFLLSLATVFVCAMIGAAIVGAFVATVFILSLAALLSFGIFSTSLAVGLYKRSVAAGFKTLLIIILGAGCAVLGIVGALFYHHYFPAQLSLQMTLSAGFIAGAFGGVIMGLSTVAVVQTVLRNISRRVTASS